MKLYVVTRADLPIGDQVAQTLHAGLEFALRYPQRAKDWHLDSNTVVCLAAKNEVELQKLSDKLFDKQLAYAEFFEPDFGNQLTAIAFIAEKCPCGHLPLVGSIAQQ